MLFMKSVESEHAFANEVNLNLTSQIEANCMSFVAWNQIENKHASNDQVQFQTNLGSCV